MSRTELIRDLQVLTVGRATAPVADVPRTGANGKPTGDVGFTVDGCVNAFVGVALHDDATLFVARITIDTVVDTATFDIDFGGIGATQVVAGPSSTPESIADALVVAAGSTYDAVGALAVDGATIVFTALDEDAVDVDVVAASGGAMTADLDATSCTWRVWYRLPGDATWYVVTATERTDTTNAGERFIVSGIERVYIEVVTADGSVRPAFARCELE